MSIEKTTDATVQLIRDNIPEGTVAKSIEEVLREETPEEARLRILNDTQPDKLSDEQKALFTYFAKVPGMDIQILDAMHGVYHYAGDRTSRHGNIAIMGGYGTGKTKLSEDLVRAICADLKLPATKMARLDASVLNKKDCAQIVSKLAGGFLLIERAGLMYPETIEKLSQAMDFRTDSLVLIIEDEKVSMRGLLRNYPDFAKKFETVISIPVFTNDELVTFARTYARENGYKMDEMGVLALYTQIGNNQKEGENNGRPIKVVANLPYYITTPIIMGLFENHVPVDSITVMVQKEVADRMQTGPGSKDYGALSLAVQYYAEPYIVANVPPNCFMPRPKVGSAVIRLTRHEVMPVETKDEKLMFSIIRASFNQRRKTLANGLKNSELLHFSKEEIEAAITACGWPLTIRGEALNLQEFARLTDELCK